MGGKVIDLEITKIRDQSIKQGIEQGIEQGQNKLVEAVERLRNGETKEEILKSVSIYRIISEVYVIVC